MGENVMDSLKNITIEGLRELRENGFKSLKIGGLNNLMLKPEESRTGCIKDAELEDLTQKREEIRQKIEKLNKEKKEIEVRIRLIRKTEKRSYEGLTEFPWREEIFPPLSRKTHAKIPGALEMKDSSLHNENSEFSEVKGSPMKIKDRYTDEKSEVNISEVNISEVEISEGIEPETIQIMAVDNAERAGTVKEIEKKVGEKAISGKEEKIKAVYPFSTEKLKENKIPSKDSSRDSSKNFSKNSSQNSVEERKSESRNNPAASLLGENLIEELLGSDDLIPEEEKGFMKYLQEPRIEELINELKDTKSLLIRAKNAG